MRVRRGRLQFAGWTLCLLALSATPVLAADADADLKTALTSSATKFADAFARRDAAALAALFTPEAEYIDLDGNVFHGRGAIQAEYAAAFEVHPPGKLSVEIVAIRPIATGVVVEDGVSTFDGEDPAADGRLHYTATHVRQTDGSWLLASVRELEAAAQTPRDHLGRLEWLLGKWREETGGSSISSEWRWSDNQQFLVSDFTVQTAPDAEWKGTHRVGWDAEKKQFRSWVFDASGASAEGGWRPNEDGSWSVQLTRVGADGSQSQSRLTYAPDGEDAIVVLQDQITTDGETLPPVSHRIVRQPPEPTDVSAIPAAPEPPAKKR